MNSKNFYITTAIAYVNGAPHIGYAYETILTDVMARFKRLDGFKVFFLTGTDEHGQKIAKTAETKNMSPKSFCDMVSEEFRTFGRELNISNDDFIRTTEPRHYAASQAIWNAIKSNSPDEIYLGHYAGWYSLRDEAYFGEEELTKGEGGKMYAPSGAPVEWVEEESFFFRLSAYADRLLKYYAEHPDFIQPDSRKNEILSFVKGGLNDLSISRTNFKWGVPVPGHPDHVMYVWLDALTNYITALGYPDQNDEKFKSFWPCDTHVIGKDIIRFHCVYWPAFLMAAGIELPKQIFAHGHINVDGQKMSKSLGNVIAPKELVDAYGVDATRFILMRDIPHGQDGNFSHKNAVQRINADLANGLGNLAQRTLSFIYKNCGGILPEPGAYTDVDKNLLSAAQEKMLPTLRLEMDKYRTDKALDTIFTLVSEANIYIDAQAPWTLKKTDPARMNTVLYVLAEVIRCLALAMQPVTPEAAGKLLDQLAIAGEARTFAALSAAHALKPGTMIAEPKGVFPRLTEEQAA